MSWTEFLYANDKKRKELLDQYYEKLKEKEEESYKDKIRDLAKEQYYAEKNVEDLEAKKKIIQQDPSSTSEDLKEIDDKLLEAKLQKQEADKALEEAKAEYITIGTSLQEEMALIQQQLATSVLKTGDTLTKK